MSVCALTCSNPKIHYLVGEEDLLPGLILGAVRLLLIEVGHQVPCVHHRHDAWSRVRRGDTWRRNCNEGAFKKKMKRNTTDASMSDQ